MKNIVNSKYISENEDEILKKEDIIPSLIFKYCDDDKIKKYFEINCKNNSEFAEHFETVEEWLNSEEKLIRADLLYDYTYAQVITNHLEEWVEFYPEFEGILNREYFKEYIENDGVLNNFKELKMVEKNFHKLIMERAGNLINKFEIPLPKLTEDLIERTDIFDCESFPITGMYGGFFYSLEIENDEYVLITDSWSRILGGSGQTHRITKDNYELIAEGFV